MRIQLYCVSDFHDILKGRLLRKEFCRFTEEIDIIVLALPSYSAYAVFIMYTDTLV